MRFETTASQIDNVCGSVCDSLDTGEVRYKVLYEVDFVVNAANEMKPVNTGFGEYIT